MRLRAQIKGSGKTAAGIVVPDEFVESLGGGRRPAVRVGVAGYSFRTSIGSMGGLFMLPVTNETRERSGLKVGETVDFEIELDTEPREVELPEALASALAADAAARSAFDTLSFTHRKEYARWIAEAKRQETRDRRVTQALEQLRQGKPLR